MEGTLEDWLKLIDKTKSLQKMFQPIMAEIGLENWFKTTLEILENLRNTYKGEPDKGHFYSKENFVSLKIPKIKRQLKVRFFISFSNQHSDIFPKRL